MQIKNTYIHTAIFILVSSGVVGCGNSNNTSGEVALTSQCVMPNDISIYQDIQSGDIIDSVGEESEIDISIHQLPDGTKKACIRSGSAVIIRE